MLQLTPFIILFIFSTFLSNLFRLDFIRSLLINILIVTYFLYFFSKIDYLVLGNYILIALSIIILIYLIYNYKELKHVDFYNLLFILITSILLILYSKNLFLYKFDDFTEYGIISKLVFTENNNPININYLDKGSHSKINILSFFQYFFLKNSSEVFSEKIALMANNFFKVVLILNIINFTKYNASKKLLLFIFTYFLIYTLSTSFDRLYVDSILGLIIANLFLISFKKKIQNVDYIIFCLLIIHITSMKFSGVIVLLGISIIFITISVLSKDYKKVIVVSLAIIFSYSINQFHHKDVSNFIKFKFKKDKFKVYKDKFKVYEDDVIYTHREQFYNLQREFSDGTTFKLYSRYKNKDINYINSKEDLKNLFTTQLSKITSDGIYHAKTFLIINKLFEVGNINLKFIEIPLNLWIWIILIIMLSIIINREKDNPYLNFTTFMYINFILCYFIVLVIWSIRNKLLNEDFTIESSWHRHLGSLILGYILFLIIKYLQKINLSTFGFIIIITICLQLTLPNSIKNFLPYSQIMKFKFWNYSKNMRTDIRKIANNIRSEIPEYSKLIVIQEDMYKGYFFPVLNYELIKINMLRQDNHRINDFISKIDNERNPLNNTYLLISQNQNLSEYLTMIDIKTEKIISKNGYDLYEIIF